MFFTLISQVCDTVPQNPFPEIIFRLICRRELNAICEQLRPDSRADDSSSLLQCLVLFTIHIC